MLGGGSCLQLHCWLRLMGMALRLGLLSVHQDLVLMHRSTANHRQRSQPARLQRSTTCVGVEGKGAQKHFTRAFSCPFVVLCHEVPGDWHFVNNGDTDIARYWSATWTLCYTNTTLFEQLTAPYTPWFCAIECTEQALGLRRTLRTHSLCALNVNKLFRKEQVRQRSVAVAASFGRQHESFVLLFWCYECLHFSVPFIAVCCIDWLHVGKHISGGNKKAAGISPSGLLAFSDVKSVTSGSPGGL